jgi:hypothetical protein
MKILFLFIVFIFFVSAKGDTLYVHTKNTQTSTFMFELFTKIFQIYQKKGTNKYLLKHVPSSTKRMMKVLKNKIDKDQTICSFGIIISQSVYAKKYYSFSAPVLPVYNSVIALKSTEVKSLRVFNKIGYEYKKGGNSYYFKLVKKFTAKGYKFQNPVFIDKYSDLLPALRSKEVDFIIGDSIDGWLNDDIKIVIELDKEPQYLAFLYESGSILKKEFDGILKYYLKSPAFYRLLEKHFGKNFRTYYLKTMKRLK